MLDPYMPVQELRLHMGELSTDEVLVARSAIQWANSHRSAVNDKACRETFARLKRLHKAGFPETAETQYSAYEAWFNQGVKAASAQSAEIVREMRDALQKDFDAFNIVGGAFECARIKKTLSCADAFLEGRQEVSEGDNINYLKSIAEAAMNLRDFEKHKKKYAVSIKSERFSLECQLDNALLTAQGKGIGK